MSDIRWNLTREEAEAVYTELTDALDGQENVNPAVDRALTKLERALTRTAEVDTPPPG